MRFTPYCVGDRVWLEAQNLTTSHPSAKLAPRRYGPFLITSVISHTSYRLKLPPQWKIHPVFHASLLTPYKETKEHGENFPEPAPDLINGQPEWEVEQILGARRRRNQLQYLIRWKGFSEAHDSWEPLTHIKADQLIEAFHEKNPAATKRIQIQPTPPQQTHPVSLSLRRIIMTTNPPPSPPPHWIPKDTPTGPMLRYTPPPLLSRIEDTPPTLTLAERISDPNPSEPESPQTQESHRSLEGGAPGPERQEMSPPAPTLSPPPSPTFTELSEPCATLVDQALHPEAHITPPRDFDIYDRTIANHVTYGEKIRLPDERWVWPHYIHFDHDLVEHKHYVMARRNETGQHTNTVGWSLKAAPFMGPAPQFPDNQDLSPFSFTHYDSHAIDLSLGELNDPGLLADIDRHRGLIAEEAALRLREKELANSWYTWRTRMTPVSRRLIAAQARTRLHPYLTNQVPLRPNRHREEEVTIGEALLLDNRFPHFHLPMPWLAGEERPTVTTWIQSGGTRSHVSSKPTQPTPRPATTYKCFHCKVPNATHDAWHCPWLNRCYYCDSTTHHPFDCPVPHTNCQHSRLGCVVPYHHKNDRKMHCPYVSKEQCDVDTQANDQEDTGHFDDVDWEATSGRSN